MTGTPDYWLPWWWDEPIGTVPISPLDLEPPTVATEVQRITAQVATPPDPPGFGGGRGGSPPPAAAAATVDRETMDRLERLKREHRKRRLER